ncbi:peptide chain release factor 2 [Buchnera aphidicola]|uniref:peptide chain release factor 2 n=1 Tax=Buchnera aphidicola TaxID=9 RepID=UPI003464CEFC
MQEKKNITNQINQFIQRVKYLKRYLEYNKKRIRLKEINYELLSPNIWKIQKSIQKLNKEKSKLYFIVNNIKKVEKKINETIFFFRLSIEEKDSSILKDILLELTKIENKIKNIEFYSMFSRKNDNCNCYMDIQSGSGGTEAQDWAQMLLRMYLKWIEKKKFKTEIIAESSGEIVGIKSTTIKIFGKYAFGWLRTETGVHRLIRKSPFDSGKRRHTSFSSVFVYPDIDSPIFIDIDISDLRIDVYRSSGAGGQHVNKTESAVRITHLPTNVVTQCQNNRSQHKNKEQAMKQMKAKLYEIQKQKKQDEKKILEKTKSDITWGSQIRSYILDNSKVKDLRTGIEKNDVQSVLDGDLDDFIENSLKMGL